MMLYTVKTISLDVTKKHFNDDPQLPENKSGGPRRVTSMKLRISEVRKSRGLTQEELADKIGMSRSYLAQIENGTRNITAKKQVDIARALEVEPAELIDFDAPDVAEEDLLVKAYRIAAPEQRKAWLELAKVVLGSEQERDG